MFQVKEINISLVKSHNAMLINIMINIYSRYQILDYFDNVSSDVLTCIKTILFIFV